MSTLALMRATVTDADRRRPTSTRPHTPSPAPASFARRAALPPLAALARQEHLPAFKEGVVPEFLREFLASEMFMPHGHCYLWRPGLVWLEVLSNGLIGISYLAISTTLGFLVWRVRDLPFKVMYVAFGVFIITCG